MSALAEEIKAAQASVAAQPPINEDMLKEADLQQEYSKLQEAITAAPEIDPLYQRLRAIMPTSKEEALSTGLKWGTGIAGLGIGGAALMSYLSHLASENRRKELIQDLLSTSRLGMVPSRELKLPVSVKRAKEDDDDDKDDKAGGGGKWAPYVLGALIGVPATAWLGSKAWQAVSKSRLPFIEDLFSTTEHPLTHPATISLGLGGTILSTMAAGKIFDTIFKNIRKKRRQRELEAAEKEFQQSLAAQYAPKAANIDSAIDLLATTYVSGELGEQIDSITKRADMELEDPWAEDPWYKGLGSGALGLYLAVLLGLGGLGVAGGHAAAKRFDKGRKRSEAIERALKRRALAIPPQPITEEKDVTELAEEPV